VASTALPNMTTRKKAGSLPPAKANGKKQDDNTKAACPAAGHCGSSHSICLHKCSGCMKGQTKAGALPPVKSNGNKQNENPDTARVAALKNPASKSSLRIALTTREACAALGCSARSLARFEARGLIKSSCALRTKMWPVAELTRFLNETSSL